jgi:hypothetical protein
MRLIPFVPVLFLAFAGVLAPAVFAQDKPAAEAPAVAQADPEVKKLAKGLIEDVLQVTHAAAIFSDLRRTLGEVYIPALRDAIQGSLPGIPAPDAKSAAAMAKILTVMDYVRKAGDELDVALSENRDAMISDAAEQIARTAEPVEIKDVQAILQLPAVRKGLDAFYAMTKLLTGFSYEDTKTFSDFSAWASQLDLDMRQGLPGTPGGAAPSKRKIAKAQALIDDLVSISHLDEMVGDVRRFVRDVYVETAPMPDEDREDLREQADQFEFTYNMQKAIVLAAAPSAIAAALSDEQLARLHGFVRSPSFTKAFDLLRNAVKSSTAFTKEDILEAQKCFQDMERKAKANERSPADQEKAKAEWDALAGKWTERLKNRISPETLQGLEKSLEDLDTKDSPI